MHYMPQELEVWYILPAIRSQMAKAMLARGLTQTEIAKKMGVTRGAVSHYIMQKRANALKFNKTLLKAIDKSAAVLAKKGNFIAQTQKICELVKKEIGICKISKQLGLAPYDCRECFK
jgi:hypothetical protein